MTRDRPLSATFSKPSECIHFPGLIDQDKEGHANVGDKNASASVNVHHYYTFMVHDL